MVCRQCGAFSGKAGDVELERRGLDDYRRLLRELDAEGKVRLLSTGFLPCSVDALIEAGLQCVPLIDENWTSAEECQAAVRRLDAIGLKLRILTTDERALRAEREFSAKVGSFRRTDHRDGVRGVVMILALLAGLVAAAVWVVRALF